MKGQTSQCWEVVDNYRFATLDLLFIQLAKKTERPIGLSLQTGANVFLLPVTLVVLLCARIIIKAKVHPETAQVALRFHFDKIFWEFIGNAIVRGRGLSWSTGSSFLTDRRFSGISDKVTYISYLLLFHCTYLTLMSPFFISLRSKAISCRGNSGVPPTIAFL